MRSLRAVAARLDRISAVGFSVICLIRSLRLFFLALVILDFNLFVVVLSSVERDGLLSSSLPLLCASLLDSVFDANASNSTNSSSRSLFFSFLRHKYNNNNKKRNK
jgi:hypothetical protein